jgi:hypothetical protein
LILNAEHSSVVQKQGSRGFVRGEGANGKLIKKPSKMRSKSITKLMENRCKIVVAGRYRRTPKGPWPLLNWYLGLIWLVLADTG